MLPAKKKVFKPGFQPPLSSIIYECRGAKLIFVNGKGQIAFTKIKWSRPENERAIWNDLKTHSILIGLFPVHKQSLFSESDLLP